MKKTLFLFCLLLTATARAEYIVNKDDPVQLSVGGYARVFTGKMEGYQYNNATKNEPYAKLTYRATDDLTLSGKAAVRFIWSDRFPSKRKLKFYDAYVTADSKMYGKIDAGSLRNVGYLMHQGPVDVGLFDIDDSDIYLFYNDPKNFFAPSLTYLNTDSRDSKISYTSPSFGGFKWGISAVESGNDKPKSCATGVKMDHGKGVITSVQYLTETDVVNIGLSGAYAYYHDDRYFFKKDTVDASHSEYSTGINLERAGYSIGASYRQIMFQDVVNIGDSDVWTVGVAYDVKKWGVSLTFLQSHADYIEKCTFNHLMASGKYMFTDWLKGTISVGQLEFLSQKSPNTRSLFAITGFEFKL